MSTSTSTTPYPPWLPPEEHTPLLRRSSASSYAELPMSRTPSSRISLPFDMDIMTMENIEVDVEAPPRSFPISLVLENSGSVARDHLASERTFLAYMRTSLAVAFAAVALLQLLTLSGHTEKALNQHGIVTETESPLTKLKSYTRPLAAASLVLALFVLILGVYRYFTIQLALTEGKFPATRIPIGVIAFSIGGIICAVFVLPEIHGNKGISLMFYGDNWLSGAKLPTSLSSSWPSTAPCVLEGLSRRPPTSLASQAMPITVSLPSPTPTSSKSVSPVTPAQILARACPDQSKQVDKILHCCIGGWQGRHDTQFKIVPNERGFVNTVLTAYTGNYALVLRPDDVWLAVISQFALYVHANPDVLGGKASFGARRGEGKPFEIAEPSSAAPISTQMGEVMEETVLDAAVREWIRPDFSTTTANDVAVGSIMMLAPSAPKDLFTAEPILKSSGGIPRVTLEGEKKDWEAIVEKLKTLKDYGPRGWAWFYLLNNVVTNMVKTFDDAASAKTTKFWEQIVVQAKEGKGGKSRLGGWVTAFCLLAADGKWRTPEIKMNIPKSKSPSSMPATRFWITYSPGFKSDVTLDNTPYPVLDIHDLPAGYAVVDIALKNGPHCSLLAGLTGVGFSSSRDSTLSPSGRNDTVRPVVAWWMYSEKFGAAAPAPEEPAALAREEPPAAAEDAAHPVPPPAFDTDAALSPNPPDPNHDYPIGLTQSLSFSASAAPEDPAPPATNGGTPSNLWGENLAQPSVFDNPVRNDFWDTNREPTSSGQGQYTFDDDGFGGDGSGAGSKVKFDLTPAVESVEPTTDFLTFGNERDKPEDEEERAEREEMQWGGVYISSPAEGAAAPTTTDYDSAAAAALASDFKLDLDFSGPGAMDSAFLDSTPAAETPAAAEPEAPPAEAPAATEEAAPAAEPEANAEPEEEDKPAAGAKGKKGGKAGGAGGGKGKKGGKKK
ncbi:hypothetical protein R3P38DRAFT_3379272 [Favolaschia claudopus]|uniref:DUF202 domain-containing protein n=1 Tax=Favolaschia claudopus TaxID=2862362 RepID=A0AAV9Z645_9AGAR